MAKILSFFDFQDSFPDEQACFDYLFKLRWPDGFKCPKCQHDQASFISTRKLFQCSSCRYQASVTAGTVFHKLRQPLQKLFLAVFLFSTSKKGISAMELQRKSGIKTYRSAWTLLHKLREGMKSSGLFPLTGPVEVDETYIGGSREGTRGRGAEGKVLVAVETKEKKKMGRAYLEPIQDAGKKELGQFVKDHVEPGTKLFTDGWKSYDHLKGLYQHIPNTQHETEKSGETLPKVHIVITNVKTWLRGTLNRYPDEKYMPRYLDEFEFRFNRRWNLFNIFDKLLTRCVQRSTITLAELMT